MPTPEALRVLGLVPARGGSKGIPRKNLQLLAGKTLLQRTAEAALAARRLSRILLSTEDAEIAEAGRRYGLEVPFMRPVELASDEAPMLPVVQHALRFVEGQGDRFDAVFLLQPTNALRRPEDVDGAVDLLEASGADSVLSFVDASKKHVSRIKYIDEQGRVTDPPFGVLVEGQRRQDLPRLYLREGSVYLTRRNVLMQQNSFRGTDCRAWIIPETRACDIDTPFELFIAEQLLKLNGNA